MMSDQIILFFLIVVMFLSLEVVSPASNGNGPSYHSPHRFRPDKDVVVSTPADLKKEKKKCLGSKRPQSENKKCLEIAAESYVWVQSKALQVYNEEHRRHWTIAENMAKLKRDQWLADSSSAAWHDGENNFPGHYSIKVDNVDYNLPISVSKVTETTIKKQENTIKELRDEEAKGEETFRKKEEVRKSSGGDDWEAHLSFGSVLN